MPDNLQPGPHKATADDAADFLSTSDDDNDKVGQAEGLVSD
jgi:hypothetical protein